MNDRRFGDRNWAEGTVRLRPLGYDAAAGACSAQVRDVSKEGLGVLAPKPLRVNSRVECSGRSGSREATVQYCISDGRGQYYVGLLFTATDPRD
jgi:hypothetical protein